MKRIYIIMLIILFIANCIAVDTLGLTDTYKGDVAKDKLLAAAKIGDYMTANSYFTKQGYTGSELDSYVIAQVILASFVDEAVFGLDESKYYKKKDVDHCAKAIQSFGVVLDQDSFSTFLSNRTCNLSPNDMFLDRNIGKSSNSGK
ncbi:TIGR04452 family lipoprotein [Leptospira andrefontaineae]|uniref:TIGR04452 family lipoprotein n=1 Tax=Leptospira andrefontaineae TaxID=2484976 RepID=A0A4R9H8B3_9LEPT|nr:TIGR04452 family lipoprotein [Leptospira andrefontaineae]TGK42272.1 TIGR04452 family lipoprotein [Leptospira andrefontaineae]